MRLGLAPVRDAGRFASRIASVPRGTTPRPGTRGARAGRGTRSCLGFDYFFSSATLMSRYHASLGGPPWICTQMSPLSATVGSFRRSRLSGTR